MSNAPTSGYPDEYVPQTRFSTLPAFDRLLLDPEFSAIAASILQITALLTRAFRDDWQPADGTVFRETLDPALFALLYRGQQTTPDGTPGGIGTVLPAPTTGPGLFALVQGGSTQFQWSDGTQWYLLGTLSAGGFKAAIDAVSPDQAPASTTVAGSVRLATDAEVDLALIAQLPGGTQANLAVHPGSLRQLAAATDFYVHEMAVAAMQVRVESGYYIRSGIPRPSNAATLAIAAASTQPRVDVVALKADDGSLVVVNGTAGGDTPTLAAGYRALAAVQVRANATNVLATDITDLRQAPVGQYALAYTPVNKAGDTLTGPLAAPSIDSTYYTQGGEAFGSPSNYLTASAKAALATSVAAGASTLLYRLAVAVPAGNVLRLQRLRAAFNDANLRLLVRTKNGATVLASYTASAAVADEAPSTAAGLLAPADVAARTLTLEVLAFGAAAGTLDPADGFSLSLWNDNGLRGIRNVVPSPISTSQNANTTSSAQTLDAPVTLSPQGGVPPYTITVAQVDGDSSLQILGALFSAITGPVTTTIRASAAQGQTVTRNGRFRATITDASGATGTVSADFTTSQLFTTVTNDTTPDPYSFNSQFSTPRNSTRTSNAVTITGINAAAPISVSGDATSKYSINGGAFTNAAGTIMAGQTVQVQHTTSNIYEDQRVTTLNIGGQLGTFETDNVSAPQNCVGVGCYLVDGRAAGAVVEGDAFAVANPLTLETLPDRIVQESFSAMEPCVQIRTASGVMLTCTVNAGIPVRGAGYLRADETLGAEVGVHRPADTEPVRWENVVAVELLGERPVQHISAHDSCFWAGDQPGAFILHHNIKAVP